MPRRRRRAWLTLVVGPLLAVALLAPTAARAAPSPSPTLPRPTDVVDPVLAVGGPRLAEMGVIVDRPSGVPAPPRVRDVSWLIADADTGEVLAAKAPHARLLPASTAKVLTALTLLPKIPPTRTHVATSAEARADGTRVGLAPGMTYTARQLFLALLMASANDAAYALADLNGGRDVTLAEMNALAASLGAHDTSIGDPAGLDAPGQTSSAYDLALLGRAALRNADFRRYSTRRTARFPLRPPPSPKPGQPSPTWSGPHTYQVQNHNQLLWTYAGTIGVKNGFTEAAQRTNIAAATRNGHTYIVTEMHSIDYGWTDPPKLLDWAFRYGDLITPVGRLVDPGEVPASPATSASSAAEDAPAGAPALAARGVGTHGPLLAVDVPGGAATALADVGLAAGGVLALLGIAVTLRSRRARHR
jgi:D-alanyl-D-alanine carboxypeptidase (penicillin-binding protein 5/6)